MTTPLRPARRPSASLALTLAPALLSPLCLTALLPAAAQSVTAQNVTPSAPSTAQATTLYAPPGSAGRLLVGMALDSGGRNDRSFNQAAWEGAQRAARDLKVQLRLFEPAPQPDGTLSRGAGPLAKLGAGLVVGVGFANNASVTEAAKNHPGTRFAVVDDLPSGPNTAGLRFREQEGSFLVGYIAALSSSTGVVGFVGGQDVPLIHKFQAGFTAGVQFVCPSCTVKAAYVGKTPAAWNDPATAQRLAAGMQQQGTDVIFAAAGGSGAGVVQQVNAAQCLKAGSLPAGVKFAPDHFAAVPRSAAYQAACTAADRPTFFIGVDSNQNYLGDDDHDPRTLNHGLTSMVKRVDNAVYTIISDVAKNRPWRSGDRGFGLQNDGVGYAADQYNAALISADMKAKLEKVKQLIIFGTVKVPTQ